MVLQLQISSVPIGALSGAFFVVMCIHVMKNTLVYSMFNHLLQPVKIDLSNNDLRGYMLHNVHTKILVSERPLLELETHQ
jgi:hypothetical protein